MRNQSAAPKRAANQVAHHWWGDRGSRVGIVARGFVFLVLAYLLARIALGGLGDGGTRKSASGPGVATAIAQQTGGHVALFLLGVGLVLFALYSVLEAFRAHDSEESDFKRWGGRAQSGFQAALYGAFSVYCLVKAFGSTGSSGQSAQANRRQEQWSAQVLRWPVGWLWLALLGVVLFLITAYQLRRCVKRTFLDDLKQERLTRRARRWVSLVGVVGHAGRAAAFALVGWFVVAAAVENDPKKGRGVDGSARMLANSSGGPVLLWLIAIGMAVFGCYQFLDARYRKI